MSNPLGNPTHLTLHWTAGESETTYPDYHFNVEGNGNVVQTHSLMNEGAHTWFRNYQNIGIGMDCLGPEHATEIQLEHTAKLVAELCIKYHINPQGTVSLTAYKRMYKNTPSDTLVAIAGSITVPTIADHAIYAEHDQYPELRWDIGSREGDSPKNLYKVILPKILWYYQKLTSGEEKPQFTLKTF